MAPFATSVLLTPFGISVLLAPFRTSVLLVYYSGSLALMLEVTAFPKPPNSRDEPGMWFTEATKPLLRRICTYTNTN